MDRSSQSCWFIYGSGENADFTGSLVLRKIGFGCIIYLFRNSDVILYPPWKGGRYDSARESD